MSVFGLWLRFEISELRLLRSQISDLDSTWTFNFGPWTLDFGFFSHPSTNSIILGNSTSFENHCVDPARSLLPFETSLASTPPTS